MSRNLLVLDTASPTVSLAVGDVDVRVACRNIELRQSSEQLFYAIDEALEEAGLSLADLQGIIVLRGPGSFTGLRVGMAAVLGLHKALGVPATAIPTLPILARTVEHGNIGHGNVGHGNVEHGNVGHGNVEHGNVGHGNVGHGSIEHSNSENGNRENGDSGRIVAAVDAMRGDWYVQVFSDRLEAMGEPGLRSAGELAEYAPCRLVGFGVERLDGAVPNTVRLVEPPPLAETALRFISGADVNETDLDWDADLLTRPIYFRAPAVTLPKKR